ncbi:MAG: HD domain-containing protein [Candidatus Marinimicrobia bacterium]|jgi:hypothetical protein|nr:HD domain-containing protein [Candidatus Neomarinimicrobiota bacterium]
MILVHDLVEAEAGDMPFLETGPRKDQKSECERETIEFMSDASEDTIDESKDFDNI